MYTRRAAFVDDVEMFDASFFGISGTEAKTMDPQQRMLLEVSYDAFHRAGYDRKALMGSDAGVFVGQCNNDWGRIDWGTTSDKMNPFTGTGMSASISANRISYTLGLMNEISEMLPVSRFYMAQLAMYCNNVGCVPLY